MLTAKVSAAGNNIPVLVSPVFVIDGAAALPSEKLETPEIVTLLNVPKLVTFVCAAVDNVPVNVVADTVPATVTV